MRVEGCNQIEDQTGKAIPVMKVRKVMKVEKVKDQEIKEIRSGVVIRRS